MENPDSSIYSNTVPFYNEPIPVDNSDVLHSTDNNVDGKGGYVVTDISKPTYTINPQEVELRSLLSMWNQEYLADDLIRQAVSVDILKIIKRHHIERLLQTFDMGVQILFEHNIEKWREYIGSPLNPHNNSFFDEFLGQSPSSPISTTGSVATSRASTPSRGDRFSPYGKNGIDSVPNTMISLSQILNETSRGKQLVDYYTKFGNFKEEQRNLLIALLAQHYEEKQCKLNLAASYQLEKEIVERFPSEKLEYYRTGKRGKIYTKYNNLMASVKGAVTKHIYGEKSISTPTINNKTRHQIELKPEDDAETCIRVLKFDNLSSDEFDRTWKACSHFRLQDIKDKSSHEIMVKWSFYKNPSGYRLIDMDFKTAFNNKDGLLIKWEEQFNEILAFLSAENIVKDKTTKQIIINLKERNDISENGRNAALVWALHGYLVPTNKIIKKDKITGKKSTTKFTIKDSQESVLFFASSQQEVEDQIMHMKKTKANVQPSIYCIGQDIFSITETFVLFENIRYKFTNVLKALDICFKIIYLFDLEFPAESGLFYNFFELFFYDFKVNQKSPKFLY